MAAVVTVTVASAYHWAAMLLWLWSLRYNVLYIGNTHSVWRNLFDWRDDGNGGKELSAGKVKYLTFLNMVIQTFYFSVCVLNNLFGSNSGPCVPSQRHSRSALQKFRDFIHASIVFPLAHCVLTFWAIYFVDRELVYPRSLDKIIPPIMNHIMHTFVLPILLVEKMLVFHQHPRRLMGCLTLASFALAYLAWILYVAYVADVWVYPILRVLDSGQRSLFIGLCLAFFFSLYLTGEALTRFLWRKEIGLSIAKKH